MYVYMYMYIYMYTLHVCVCVCVYMYTYYIYICVCVCSIYIYIYMCVCECTFRCDSMFNCAIVGMHVCMHALHSVVHYSDSRNTTMSMRCIFFSPHFFFSLMVYYTQVRVHSIQWPLADPMAFTCIFFPFFHFLIFFNLFFIQIRVQHSVGSRRWPSPASHLLLVCVCARARVCILM